VFVVSPVRRWLCQVASQPDFKHVLKLRESMDTGQAKRTKDTALFGNKTDPLLFQTRTYDGTTTDYFGTKDEQGHSTQIKTVGITQPSGEANTSLRIEGLKPERT
jgi:hypothetical protein